MLVNSCPDIMAGNSDNNISEKVLQEITSSLQNIKGWGSIEIFVQNNKVTQITEKNICKKENLSVIDSY